MDLSAHHPFLAKFQHSNRNCDRPGVDILPELIASHRPQGHSLLAVEEAIITTNTEVRFVGALFDMFY